MRMADVEIIERHHRFKEDSPSGTALKFGEIVARAMGQSEHRHGREGRPGKRPHGEIGFHAVRVGDNPGEHTIIFGLLVLAALGLAFAWDRGRAWQAKRPAAISWTAAFACVGLFVLVMAPATW